VKLTFDTAVEEFRAEFVAFLDANLPTEAEAGERPRSSAHVPEWARRWQRRQFDNGASRAPAPTSRACGRERSSTATTSW
jgi:hypothetical protein